MTRIYLCKTDAPPSAVLSDFLTDHIGKAKSGALYKSRLSAYSLLCFAVTDFLKLPENIKKCGACADFLDFELSFGEKGKPYLSLNGERSPIEISISHTDEYSAVAVSDSVAVGVDIEAEITKERADRLKDRYFFEPIEKSRGTLELLSTLDGGRVSVFAPVESAEEKNADFTERWVCCEALLKLDGGGFGSLPSLKDIVCGARVYCTTVSGGREKHSLAVAKSKEN